MLRVPSRRSGPETTRGGVLYDSAVRAFKATVWCSFRRVPEEDRPVSEVWSLECKRDGRERRRLRDPGTAAISTRNTAPSATKAPCASRLVEDLVDTRAPTSLMWARPRQSPRPGLRSAPAGAARAGPANGHCPEGDPLPGPAGPPTRRPARIPARPSRSSRNQPVRRAPPHVPRLLRGQEIVKEDRDEAPRGVQLPHVEHRPSQICPARPEASQDAPRQVPALHWAHRHETMAVPPDTVG